MNYTSTFLKPLMRPFAMLLLGTVATVGCRAQTTTLPRPDHIVILIEENEPESWIVGSSSILGDPQSYAPNINALAADTNSAVFTSMLAIIAQPLSDGCKPSYVVPIASTG